MSKLDAINQMLTVIGQVPVKALPESPRTDAGIALGILEEYTKELQSEGYDFNTLESYEATPKTNGTITFQSAVIRAWNPGSYPRLTLRQGFLFDIDRQSYIFDKSVRVNLVQFVDYEILPYALQRYVVVRASRVFANRVVGAGEINSYTQEDEMRARIAWMEVYTEDMALNVLSGPQGHRPSTFTPFSAINRY